MTNVVDKIKNREAVEVKTIEELVDAFRELKDADFKWRDGADIETDYEAIKKYMIVLTWKPFKQEWQHLLPQGAVVEAGTNVLGYFKYDTIIIMPHGGNTICFERDGDVTPTGEETFIL